MDTDKDRGDVKRFLNRCLGLAVDAQRVVFELFSRAHDVQVAQARATGTYDEGVSDLAASTVARTRAPQVLATDPLSGAALLAHHVHLDRGVSWEQARALDARDGGLDDEREHWRGTGFYLGRNTWQGRTLALWATPKPHRPDLIIITRPSTGKSSIEMQRVDFNRLYRREPDADKVAERWQGLYDDPPQVSKQSSREKDIAILSGTVLPFWNCFETVAREHAAELSRGEKELKVVRVVLTDSGERVVGIRLPPQVLEPLREQLDEWVQARAAIRETIRQEDVKPRDEKAAKRATTKPQQSMHDFFGAARPGGAAGAATPSAAGPAASAGGGGASASGGAPGEPKAAATAPAQRPSMGSKRAAAAAPAAAKGKGKKSKPAIGIGAFFKPKPSGESAAAAAAGPPTPSPPAGSARSAGNDAVIDCTSP